MRFILPMNPNCPLRQASMHDLVSIQEGKERRHHPGTDGRETQWENELLPNYRSVGQCSAYYPS